MQFRIYPPQRDGSRRVTAITYINGQAVHTNMNMPAGRGGFGKIYEHLRKAHIAKHGRQLELMLGEVKQGER